MDKTTRTAIERATQQARKLLEGDLSAQLEGTFDILRSGVIAPAGGVHLSSHQHFQRDKIVAAIEHKRAAGTTAVEAITDYVRDAAFTMLNRFVALKMLEARQLVQECITKGEQSAGFREFCGMAPGVALLPDAAGYRLYVECLFDEFSTEIKVLFDRRDAASVIWPKRQTFEALLVILNASDLYEVWDEDETIGWVYQFFNSGEERRKLRDESPTPRSSRELAVRNQFFTPRYIVEFLTDNTLGRIWSEMHGQNTRLTELCEYLPHSDGNSTPARPRKDPRDLRILDPACGSGHFLLYSFDLLLVIYEEAWSAEGPVPKCEVTGYSLRHDYPDLTDLRRAVPRLIVEHNLHGVDIDPRCAQIAALALWLRAQRAWKDLHIAASERPRIQRTHIIVAEPMPHDTALVEEFAARLAPPLLRDLFKKMVDESRLAGELGVLLRVEDAIAAELHRAREQFMTQRQAARFLPGLEPAHEQGTPDLSGIDDDRFFHEAEARIIEALRGFAETASGGANVRRRLFAGDTAQGIALIDLLRTRFDVVLMNPPFDTPPASSLDQLNPRDAGNCTLHSFDAHTNWVPPLSAASLTGRFSHRQRSIGLGPFCYRRIPKLILLADLGWGVLDANVQVCAYVLARNTNGMCAFADARDIPNKETRLRPDSSTWHWKNCTALERLPDSVLAYSVPNAVLEKLTKWRSLADIADLPRGLGSNKAARTYLAWFEVAHTTIGSQNRWASLANGGEYSPYWRQDLGVADWRAPDGNLWVQMPSSDSWRLYDQSGTNSYFKRGLLFPKQSSAFHVSVLPDGFLPTREGKAILPYSSADILPLIAYLNSGVVRAFIRDTCGLHKQGGAVGRIPVPEWNQDTLNAFQTAALKLISFASDSYRLDETSRTFVAPEGILAPRGLNGDRKTEMLLVADEIDRICRSVFEIAPDDLGWLMPTAIPSLFEPSAMDIVSWAVGVAFARFDIRIATGERPCPPKQDPFHALQAKSPGMIPDGDPPFMECLGILVDDVGHADDLVGRVVAVYEHARQPPPEPDELRRILAREFFSIHIKAYSKSRRKAPVYWQLSTPTASYSVWLYVQALTKDTVFRVQNDYVAPKLAHEQHQLESLRTDSGSSPSGAQRKAIAAQGAFVDELGVLLEEVKRVAPLWFVDLDDGVAISFAPLWRLVPQQKAWQSELKDTWDDLVAGKSDWARLAMHLWPERVIPKCARDRSLAIAHDLVDIFWIETSEDKWKLRPSPTRSVDELVHEGTSVAVKAALKELTEASAPSGQKVRTRRAVS